MIKAIVFDLWNTLYYYDRLDPILEFKDKYGITDIKLIENILMKRKFTSLEEMLETFCNYFNVKKEPLLIQTLAKMFRQGLTNAKPFPDTIAQLKELKNKYRLGLISNLDQFTGERIRELGFLELFDAACLSYEEGHIKPEKEIFTKVAQKLGLEPSQILLVGDNPTDDLIPAKALGFNTILIKREVKYHKVHVETEIYPNMIKTLPELFKYLNYSCINYNTKIT